MKNIKQLKIIEKITKNHEQIAGRQLAQLSGALATEKKRLENLKNFVDEYAKLPAQKQAMSSSQMQYFIKFLNHLEQSIGKQQQNVTNLEMDMQQRKTKWLNAYKQHQGVEKFLDKKLQEARQEQEILQQKLDDTTVTDNFHVRNRED